MTGVWHHDWRERVQQHVRERGFDTVTAFAESQPTASLRDLAAQLGDDVGASNIERLLVDEAEEAGTMKRCAMSLLVRQLNAELPEGWQTEWIDEPGGAGKRLSSASSSVHCALPGPYQDAFRRVDDALWKGPVAPGWLPRSPDDPVLVQFFRDYWDTANDPEVKAERKARWLAEHYEPMRLRARELGFDSLTAFAESRPLESTFDLGYQLCNEAVDRELARGLVYEAEKAGTLERCARSLLARALHSHLPQGWQLAWTTHPFGTGPRKFSAFDDLLDALHYRNEPVIAAIWDALDQMPMAEGWLPRGPDDLILVEGWLPRGPDDPILVEVFARHWQDPEPDE
jgi:hypothetical protein